MIMSDKPDFVFPPVSQIGVVVKDVKKTVDYFSRVFGMGPFDIKNISLGPGHCWIKGKPFVIEPHPVAFVQLGPIQLELIEPPRDGIHKRFLDSRGEGLHHLCYRVENYDAWMAHLKEQGVEILMNVIFDQPETGPVRVAYLESDKTGGVLFEIAESKLKI
jgi:methylmalonyl-CoA/ethylmalonyl-CoA epimerase